MSNIREEFIEKVWRKCKLGTGEPNFKNYNTKELSDMYECADLRRKYKHCECAEGKIARNLCKDDDPEKRIWNVAYHVNEMTRGTADSKFDALKRGLCILKALDAKEPLDD
jgi:hypothetical protein